MGQKVQKVHDDCPLPPGSSCYLQPLPEAINVLDLGEIFLKYFMHIGGVHIYSIPPHTPPCTPFTHTVLNLV